MVKYYETTKGKDKQWCIAVTCIHLRYLLLLVKFSEKLHILKDHKKEYFY